MREVVREIVFRHWENPEVRVIGLRIIAAIVFLGAGLGWACAFWKIEPGVPAIAFGAFALLVYGAAYGILEMRFSNVPPVPTSAPKAGTSQDSDDEEDKRRREWVSNLLINRDSSRTALRMTLTR